MIKTAFVFGGSYVVGSWAGGKIADAAKLDAGSSMRTGAKIAAGVVAFFVIGSVLR